MDIINIAEIHLKEQGIDQWHKGYLDYQCIENDRVTEKGYFVVTDDEIL